MTERVPYLASRLQGFGTTIFAEMSALAVETGSINLGQGFPDTDGPPEVLRGRDRRDPRTARTSTRPGSASPTLRHAIARAPDALVRPRLRSRHRGARHRRRDRGDRRRADLALCEPGDEVVTFEPYYDSYAACIAMAGATHRLVQLRPPGYSFDPDELRAAVTPRTRLLLLNSPHNPTGKVFSRDELTTIAEVCVEHDLIVVTDEVYEHLVFDGEHIPLATLPGMRERTS